MARTETVTVVFTDLVGSSELASRLGHDAYEALRHEHFAALRTAVTKHGGTEVKTTGDGLMLRFDSAADAIACAIAMQQATDGAARTAHRQPLQIRVGMSSGEATHDNQDLFGPPVVEASRLCAAAASGPRGPAVGRAHALRLGLDAPRPRRPRRPRARRRADRRRPRRGRAARHGARARALRSARPAAFRAGVSRPRTYLFAALNRT